MLLLHPPHILIIVNCLVHKNKEIKNQNQKNKSQKYY